MKTVHKISSCGIKLLFNLVDKGLLCATESKAPKVQTKADKQSLVSPSPGRQLLKFEVDNLIVILLKKEEASVNS